MVSFLRGIFAAAVICCTGVLPAYAQTQAVTLEDVRLDIATLSEIMQVLRSELLATGNSGVLQESVGTILQRLNALEADLSAALGLVEALEFRVVQIADDALRRISDLEFRLTELEGGDTGALGTPVPLGGQPKIGINNGAQQLASDEKRSFDAGLALLDAGDFQAAAEQFERFTADYPGGPLTTEAQYRRGLALAGLQDWGTAARNYLDAFSGAPDGPFAAVSLSELARSLAELGQIDQACLTLDEIGIRYQNVSVDLGAQILGQKQLLACP
ncbi:MAG: tetratricopeptide repeat protein [Paracoccaceae bacterium]